MTLTVISHGHRYPNGRNSIAGVLVRCSCGNEKVIPKRKLETTKSCGCAKGWHGHGATYEKHRMVGSPTYRSWSGMMQRCFDSEATSWENYGGRGITVCARWQDFRNFFADMGERPKGTSIDRLQVDGDYEPGNCRWATASEQRLNQRPKTN